MAKLHKLFWKDSTCYTAGLQDFSSRGAAVVTHQQRNDRPAENGRQSYDTILYCPHLELLNECGTYQDHDPRINIRHRLRDRKAIAWTAPHLTKSQIRTCEFEDRFHIIGRGVLVLPMSPQLLFIIRTSTPLYNTLGCKPRSEQSWILLFLAHRISREKVGY